MFGSSGRQEQWRAIDKLRDDHSVLNSVLSAHIAACSESSKAVKDQLAAGASHRDRLHQDQAQGFLLVRDDVTKTNKRINAIIISVCVSIILGLVQIVGALVLVLLPQLTTKH